MEFNENSGRRVINFDMDGTLTKGEAFWTCEPQPHTDNIDLVRRLYKNGHIIIIHTARQWEYAPETVAWLIKHRVPYHGIYMAKGGADFYVDDKNAHLFQLLPMTEPGHEEQPQEGADVLPIDPNADDETMQALMGQEGQPLEQQDGVPNGDLAEHRDQRLADELREGQIHKAGSVRIQ